MDLVGGDHRLLVAVGFGALSAPRRAAAPVRIVLDDQRALAFIRALGARDLVIGGLLAVIAFQRRCGPLGWGLCLTAVVALRTTSSSRLIVAWRFPERRDRGEAHGHRAMALLEIHAYPLTVRGSLWPSRNRSAVGYGSAMVDEDQGASVGGCGGDAHPRLHVRGIHGLHPVSHGDLRGEPGDGGGSGSRAQQGHVWGRARMGHGRMVAGKLLSGALADRLGGRRVFLSALAITATTAAAFSLARSHALLCLLNFTMLLAASAGWPAMSKLIAAWYEPDRYGKVWGVVSTSSRLSSVLSTLLLGALLARVSWPRIFLVAGAATAAVAAAISVLLKAVRRTSGCPHRALPQTRSRRPIP
jgi:MFS family permease